MKQFIILTSLVLLIGYSAFAQVTSLSPDIKSPNIASLGVYGDLPVSLFTGTPDISIPLTTIKGKNIDLPLVLRYNANSIKPNQRGGWVGLGWNLSVGSIYRETKGYPDEMDCESIQATGYYFRRNLVENDWYQVGEAPNLQNNDRIIRHLELASYADLEADIFHFSVMGLQGTFFLDHNGKWQVQSDQFVSVELDSVTPFIDPLTKYAFSSSNLVSKAFNKFILKDGYGNEYIFGSSQAIEYTSIINAGVIPVYGVYQEASGVTLQASAWHISEIRSANGVDTIEFSYERGPYVTSLYKYGYSNITYKNSNCYHNGSAAWFTGGSLISPVYLKEIKTDHQKLSLSFSKSDELNYSEYDYQNMQNPYMNYIGVMEDVINNSSYDIPYYIDHNLLDAPYYNTIIWMKLDSMKYEVNNERFLSIDFSYNDLSNERLFLQTASFLGKKSTEIYKYSFAYNGINQMPGYLQSITDHWGFYNGVGFGTFIPGNIYTNRQPSSSFALKGILSQIIYPTGGTTEFEFELGDYSKIVNKSNRKNIQNESGTGGVRIHKIKSFDEENNLALFREYVYKSNSIAGGTTSSGVLNNKPLYYLATSTATDMSDGSFTFSSFKNSSFQNLSDQNGIMIGYSEVMEITGEGGTSYYKVEKFSNHDNNFTDDNAVYGFKSDLLANPPFNDRSYERGRLLRTVYYNNMKEKMKSVTNTYDVDNIELNSSRSLMYNYLDVAVSCNVEYYYPSSVAYLKYSGPVFLTSSVDSLFTDHGVLFDKKTYQYNNDYKVLIKKTETTSKGETQIYNYTYAYDYTSNPGSSSVYDTMRNENLLLFPVEESIKRDGFFTSATVNEYSTFGDVIKNANTFALRSETPLSNYLPAHLPVGPKGELSKDSRLERIYSIKNYDDRANPLEINSQDQPAQSYIWGYNNTYPIAEVKNARNDLSNGIMPVGKFGYVAMPEGYHFTSATFTTETTGDIKITAQGDPEREYTIEYIIGGHSGYLCASRRSTNTCVFPESVTLPDMPAGTYTLNIYTDSGDGNPYVTYNYYGIQIVTSGVRNFFHTSFEETDGNSTSGDAVTGKYSRTGGYEINLSYLTAGSYILSYWKKDGSKWEYHESTVSVAGTTYNMSLTGQVDEVRLYPADARMTTYTYEPVVGMTSKCDENSDIIYYEYDELSRLALVRDGKGKILKKYCYNYAGEQEDCTEQ